MSSSITVLVRSRDNGSRLRRYLPIMLDQEYSDFEVLVVVEPCIDNTIEVLERLELRYPHLRHINVPRSSRFISDEQLSLSLGIRAARHDWIVLTQGDCYPKTKRWLHTMSLAMNDNVEAIAAYANFENDHTGSEAPFMRAYLSLCTLRFATSWHYIYRIDACNMALNRNAFLASGGFGKYVVMKNGAISLWANSCHHVAAVRHADACVMQRMPDGETWFHFSRLEWMETRRHLSQKCMYRLLFALRAIMPMLMFLVCIAAEIGAFTLNDRLWDCFVALAGDKMDGSVLNYCGYCLQNLWVLPLLIYGIYVIITQKTLNRQLRALGGPTFGFSAWWYRLIYPIKWLFRVLEYAFTDRRLFMKNSYR